MAMLQRLLLCLVVIFSSSAALASMRSPPSQLSYRVGDVWGREPIGMEQMLSQPVLGRAALAVANYGRATAFYLGNYAGHHVMATNYHVQRSMNCADNAAMFPFAPAVFACEQVLGRWSIIDLALFTIDVPQSHAAYFDDIALPFAFDAPIAAAQPLLTLGYGIAGNPEGLLTGGGDDDCRIFSADDTFALISDPDRINPGRYKAWSFAHGCDSSHGDSGSPILDRRTGAVLGLLWTGGFPSPSWVGVSSMLQQVPTDSPAIWKNLRYAVPAPQIAKVLRAELARGALQGDAETVVRTLLAETLAVGH